MRRATAQLALPQPCHESWDAMTPTGTGRHCAACQKVVVDFTQKTDAEILAYFQAYSGFCGHFRAEQLNRPLLVAAAPPPRRRWPAWLALLLATWNLQPAAAAGPNLPATQQAPRRRAQPRRRTSTLAVKYVRGIVRDAATHEALAGAAVFLRGENRMVMTDSAGRFQLRLPTRRPRGGRALLVHFVGYQSETVRLPATTRASTSLALHLSPDPAAAGVQVVGYQSVTRHEVTGGAPQLITGAQDLSNPPAAAPPARTFWQWLRHLFK